MDLPSNEKTFLFKHEGQLTGRLYEGTFKVKCVLTLADKRALEVERSSLSLDLSNPSSELNAISDVVANLRVRVIDCPDWFKQSIKALDTLDDELFFEIYSKCIDASNEWVDKVKGESVELASPDGEKSEGNSAVES
jgi:hypothetical protein